jgi:hypothetical protein
MESDASTTAEQQPPEVIEGEDNQNEALMIG